MAKGSAASNIVSKTKGTKKVLKKPSGKFASKTVIKKPSGSAASVFTKKEDDAVSLADVGPFVS